MAEASGLSVAGGGAELNGATRSSEIGARPSSGTGTGSTVYVLHQRFRYDYTSPVRNLRHRLMVVPRAVHGDQRRLDHRLTVTGAPALVSTTIDGFGNYVVDIRATTVDAAIEFDAWARVRHTAPGGVTTLPPSAVGDRRYVVASELTRADDHLTQVASELAAVRSRNLDRAPAAMEVAERACAWAHRALRYGYDFTDVHTTAAEAVTGGRGVCQDFAHVMLAVCRAASLPARYVSGHLVGEGGSHAWVEVVVADASRPGRAEAVAFDPTHDRRARSGYITVAVGRDYADVAPTSGTFEGDGPGMLTGRKHLSQIPGDTVETL